MKGLHTLTQESGRRMYKVRVARGDSKGADITPKQRQADRKGNEASMFCLLAVGLLACLRSLSLALALSLSASVCLSFLAP